MALSRNVGVCVVIPAQPLRGGMPDLFDDVRGSINDDVDLVRRHTIGVGIVECWKICVPPAKPTGA
jgi:hypothetical protein